MWRRGSNNFEIDSRESVVMLRPAQHERTSINRQILDYSITQLFHQRHARIDSYLPPPAARVGPHRLQQRFKLRWIAAWCGAAGELQISFARHVPLTLAGDVEVAA